MKRILKITGIIAVFAGLLVLLSFVNKRQTEVVCWSLTVEIDDANDFRFIDQPMVLSVVYDLGDSLVGTRMDAIDIARIHKSVLAMHGVDQVEVVKSLDGQVKITICQRTPILRIQTLDGHGFYIDEQGEPMALTTNYTARVPVALGEFPFTTDEVLSNWKVAAFPLVDELFTIVNYTNTSTLWKSQTDHFYYNTEGDIELIPRVGNHRIILGDSQRIAKKLKKLEAFYHDTVGKKDLNKYTTINLKYRDQVVCTKRPW
jgi:cell division protein FtsQ